jgi:hypothetical protein
MGFLDHTTNNVIIDAVLTERGRELLARNDGSFRIDSFAFGDDEVDYSNIVKYGLNIGKEKIEKNTPIFEAQTNENSALKYNNITLSNSNLRILYIPNLQKITPATASISLTLNNTNNSTVFQTVEIISTLSRESGQTAIDSNLADTEFEIKMNGLILAVYSSGLLDTRHVIDEDENFVRTYRVDGVPSYSSNLPNPNDFALSNRYKLTFDIGLISNLNTKAFSQFGTLTSTTVNNVTTLNGTINTYIEIVGLSSGSRLLIPIEITLN